MDVHNLIEVKPDVMLGKSVIKGTRIPVELIVRKLGDQSSTEDIFTAQEFAADFLAVEEIAFA